MISAYVGSHIGTARTNHEDNFLLNGEHFIGHEQLSKMSRVADLLYFEETDISQQCALFSVADGMGGHAAGDVASGVTMQLLMQSKKAIIEAPSLHGAIEQYQTFLQLLNNYIINMGKKNVVYHEMGTTVVTLIVHGDEAAVVNLGDSKGFMFNPETGLTKLTKDQTYGQVLLKKGVITENQLDDNPQYKGLVSYIGMESSQVEGDVSAIIPIDSQILFILCSDGLTDFMGSSEIETVLEQHKANQDWKSAIVILIEKVLSRGGQDNITIMIIACQHEEKDRLEELY